MATHSSILAWKITWTEEPVGPHTPWGHKESDMTKRLNLYFVIMCFEKFKKRKKSTVCTKLPAYLMSVVCSFLLAF